MILLWLKNLCVSLHDVSFQFIDLLKQNGHFIILLWLRDHCIDRLLRSHWQLLLLKLELRTLSLILRRQALWSRIRLELIIWWRIAGRWHTKHLTLLKMLLHLLHENRERMLWLLKFILCGLDVRVLSIDSLLQLAHGWHELSDLLAKVRAVGTIIDWLLAGIIKFGRLFQIRHNNTARPLWTIAGAWAPLLACDFGRVSQQVLLQLEQILLD